MTPPETGRQQIIEADWTWTGDRFEAGVQVEVDAAGRIARVGSLGLGPTRRLAGQALLPGFINAHSHAFQRGLRGRGERFPGGPGSFWTWRDAMYAVADSLDGAAFARLCRQAFEEMLDAGITTVGEFHYFHHTRGQRDYAFDRLVLEAAREAGLRIVLLSAYYRTGGIRQPLAPAQRRFESISPAAYWEQMDRLDATLDPRTQTLGVVAHSIRAAEPEELIELHGEAYRRGMMFHMHVEEQRKEIEESLAAFGKPPMRLINELLAPADNLTAVHCTHTAPADLSRFLERGGRVCICPLTEANLGDGVPDLAPALAAEHRLSLGTDSNARISMFEEMRWLEYVQRLKYETRGVLRARDGAVARLLLNAATVAGARALGVPAGAIEPGFWADFASIDLARPALSGWEPETLPEMLAFGADSSVLGPVCVGGHWRDPAGR